MDNTETSTDGIRARIALLIGEKAPHKWAQEVGIASATFSRIWKEHQTPKTETLIKIASACGVSLDWLMLGVASDSRPVQIQGQPMPVPFNRALFSAVSRIVRDAHAEAGVRLPPSVLEDITYDKYERIAGRGLAGERLAGALDYLAADLQAELAAAKAAPGTGKRVG